MVRNQLVKSDEAGGFCVCAEIIACEMNTTLNILNKCGITCTFENPCLP